MSSKVKQAAGYLAAWIRTSGRFDLKDLADRAGVADELEFVAADVLELLDDQDYLFDLQDLYTNSKVQEEKKVPFITEYLRELTGRYFG